MDAHPVVEDGQRNEAAAGLEADDDLLRLTVNGSVGDGLLRDVEEMGRRAVVLERHRLVILEGASDAMSSLSRQCQVLQAGHQTMRFHLHREETLGNGADLFLGALKALEYLSGVFRCGQRP